MVNGAEDTLAGPPGPLAQAFARGEATTVPGTHMNAVTNPAFNRAVVSFLDGLPRW